jgi:hypothetical protein
VGMMEKNLLYYAQKQKKESWNVESPETVLEYYNKKEIDKKYALYLLSNIAEMTNDMDREKKALTYYCKIHPKNSKLFSFIEFYIVSSDSWVIRFHCVVLGQLYFPEKIKKVVNEVYQSESNFIENIIDSRRYAQEYILLRFLATCIEEPIYQVFMYFKWFFDNNYFYINLWQKRLFGRYRYFHGNLAFKIQGYTGEETIYNIDETTEVIEDFKYEDINQKDIHEIELKTSYHARWHKVLNIKNISKNYFWGISYSFFRRIFWRMNKLFNLTQDDYFFSFIRNKSVYFLYIDIPQAQLEILIPAKRCKK